MSKLRALVVDDEHNILELIEYNLTENGYDVVTVDEGDKAIEIASREDFDIILLDVMLPGKSGLDICKELRTVYNKKTPIIMLTAKSEEIDKILGLEFGADDYVTKPFSVRELMARIRAVIRRYENTDSESSSQSIIKVGNITINDERHEVMAGDRVIDLTLKEFELLWALARNRGRVMTRECLLDSIWGFDYIGETRTVDVHVRYLRRKIGDDQNLIETIRGIGYKIK